MKRNAANKTKRNQNKGRRTTRRPRDSINPKVLQNGLLSEAIIVREPSSRQSYVDIDIDGAGIGATFTPTKVFDPLIAAGGLLRSFPQLCRVAAGGSANTPKWFKNIFARCVELNLNISGSQSNTLVASDLYNRLRVVIWETKFPFSSSNVASWDIDSLTDWTRVSKLHYDNVVQLSSTAFDASNYNVPQTAGLRAMIPINHRYEFRSLTTTGGLPTSFDTFEDNLFFGVVSDSTVAPHPNIQGTLRLYYDELDQ